MFMIKCLNGFVIKWTEKINHFGHIINHGEDDCLSKQCVVNGLVNTFNSNVKVLWPNMTFYARRQKFHLQNRSGAEVL